MDDNDANDAFQCECSEGDNNNADDDEDESEEDEADPSEDAIEKFKRGFLRIFGRLAQREDDDVGSGGSPSAASFIDDILAAGAFYKSDEPKDEREARLVYAFTLACADSWWCLRTFPLLCPWNDVRTFIDEVYMPVENPYKGRCVDGDFASCSTVLDMLVTLFEVGTASMCLCVRVMILINRREGFLLQIIDST